MNVIGWFQGTRDYSKYGVLPWVNTQNQYTYTSAEFETVLTSRYDIWWLEDNLKNVIATMEFKSYLIDLWRQTRTRRMVTRCAQCFGDDRQGWATLRLYCRCVTNAVTQVGVKAVEKIWFSLAHGCLVLLAAVLTKYIPIFFQSPTIQSLSAVSAHSR